MARILLLGSGPLPHENPERLGFPQLRTDGFLQVLLQAGHDVRLVLLGSEPAEGAPEQVLASQGYPAAFEVLRVQEESADWLSRTRNWREEVRPHVVVSAGPYNPARLAALIVEEEPLWVDVPGDPFAEAQAKSAHLWSEGQGDPTADMLAAYGPALGRADAFSTISHAQRFALLGQLGILGRLPAAPLGRSWVHVVPAAMRFGSLSAAEPRVRAPDSDLIVALSGGYNTWLDADALLQGLLLAMNQIPGLQVVSTGGGIPGHHTETYEGFRTLALASHHASRFTFHGWVPHRVVPDLLARAHVGVCMDRPGHEPELGTRTRVLFYLHQGLVVFATPRSELVRELAGLRMIFPVRSGDSRHLAAGLSHLAAKGQDGAQVRRARGYLLGRYSEEQVVSGLLEWLRAPFRVPPLETPEARLSTEIAHLKAELAAVYASPTWQVGSTTHRVLKRGGRRIGRLFGRDD
jgi:hypothetical protein